MADKAATIYIIDVGQSMGEKNNGREQTDLEFALQYVFDKITTTISNGRKTDMIGTIAMRTDDSANDLALSDPAYKHLTSLTPIRQHLLPDLQLLQSSLIPSSTNLGDGISALILAIQTLLSYCRHLKYIKSIFLLTNGRGSFDPDGLDEIAAQIRHQNIKLTILGVDFDDAEYGFKEENKDEKKKRNEETLRGLCEQVEGNFGTMQEAVEELWRPRLKVVRPVASYKGTLSLGDEIGYRETSLEMGVERYPRTAAAKPVSASRFVVGETPAEKEEGTKTGGIPSSGQALEPVRQARTYAIENPAEPGGKQEVEQEELVKGYKYGRTIVPISKTDEEVTIYPTEPSYRIVGFMLSRHYKPHHSLSSTSILLPQKGNPKAAVALSSLIHTLYELDMLAICRFVKRKSEPPIMTLLSPEITPEYECLLETLLPFSEDIRPFQFPPLGTVKTISGKQLTTHRNIPTDELETAMSDWVDSMDLTKLDADGQENDEKEKDGDDDEKDDFAPIEELYNPVISRINQCIKHRALYPDAPLPGLPAALTQFSHPPSSLVSSSVTALDALITAADVKSVLPESQSRKRRRGGDREQVQPKSGLDIEALLASGAPAKKQKISLENAVPEFKQRLSSIKEEQEFKELAGEMMSHVKELVKSSLGSVNYARACELLRVVRDEAVEGAWAGVYNEEIRGVKEELVAGGLPAAAGGERKEWWAECRRFGLGLVTEEEAEGGVEEGEAKAFMKVEK
ncbi:putative Ku family DNA helicase [Pyronema domesticum]|nr:putative Ku family DNA helicase [Pyronema domesticum]